MVHGALKLILEPIFEADFQSGSFGYRPKKSARAAIRRVSKAILEGKTYVIDFDLRSYFDTVQHHIVLEKVARRIEDEAVLWLLKLVLKASGKQGVPQGGVISPLLSNLYLNEVNRMLKKAKEVTRHERWTKIEYARFADDLVILVDSHPRQQWLRQAVEKRLREELAKLQVDVNEEKSPRSRRPPSSRSNYDPLYAPENPTARHEYAFYPVHQSGLFGGLEFQELRRGVGCHF